MLSFGEKETFSFKLYIQVGIQKDKSGQSLSAIASLQITHITTLNPEEFIEKEKLLQGKFCSPKEQSDLGTTFLWL